MIENMSEIAKFREQQELRDQAARQGLYGLAVVANHASITARMERGADHLLKLISEGKHEEVIVLMQTPSWGVEEDGALGQKIHTREGN
jgi:uncharacterized protein YbbK (DUF523 family)